MTDYVAARDTTLNDEIFLKGEPAPISAALFEAQRATGHIVTRAEYEALEAQRAQRASKKADAVKAADAKPAAAKP